MTAKKTIEDIDLAGKTVLVRVDFNVPFAPGTTQISDDSRIRASIPTIEYLRSRGCRVVLCSHVGRPGGKIVEALRLAPVSARLWEILGAPVAQADDCVGASVKAMVAGLEPGGVLMLENTRFHPEEESNDPEFASQLAELADVYVNDAFGAAHRAHASIEGVARHLPAVAGLLLARELDMLGRVLESPEHPFAAIFGGAKVSDKLGALRRLAGQADTLIVGGGMAATFLAAKGLNVGDSSVEADMISDAARLIEVAASQGSELLLPVDVVVANEFSEDAECRAVGADSIPDGWLIMDIGPSTGDVFSAVLAQAKTVVWNGPAGVFEWDEFSHGTKRIASAVAGLCGAMTVVGGGSTAEAVARLGLTDKMSHVSTGGGASLDYLSGKSLPGVDALMDR
jgi:phosphoglycerate kinase